MWRERREAFFWGYFGNNRGSGVIISDDSQDESEPLGDVEEEQLLPGLPLNAANVARRWI